MTSEETPFLTFELAQMDEHVEALRRLRNSGREHLFDRRSISEEEQMRWWRALDPELRARTWLVRASATEPPCAYFTLWPRLLRGAGPPGRRTWVTLVVAETHRGRGIGSAIYRNAPPLASETVWAAMWRVNVASYAAARRAAYIDVPEFDTAETRTLRSPP